LPARAFNRDPACPLTGSGQSPAISHASHRRSSAQAAAIPSPRRPRGLAYLPAKGEGSRREGSCSGSAARQPLLGAEPRRRASRHEPDNAAPQGSASLRTGTAPIPTSQVVSPPRPSPCESTYAGAVSHAWRSSSTALWKGERGSCNGAPLCVRALRRPGADLLVLRPRQHLLRARMCRSVPAQQAARCRPALSRHAQWPAQPCRARQRLPRPAKKSDASGFTSFVS
jgi:hypothetical protein